MKAVMAKSFLDPGAQECVICGDLMLGPPKILEKENTSLCGEECRDEFLRRLSYPMYPAFYAGEHA